MHVNSHIRGNIYTCTHTPARFFAAMKCQTGEITTACVMDTCSTCSLAQEGKQFSYDPCNAQSLARSLHEDKAMSVAANRRHFHSKDLQRHACFLTVRLIGILVHGSLIIRSLLGVPSTKGNLRNILHSFKKTRCLLELGTSGSNASVRLMANQREATCTAVIFRDKDAVFIARFAGIFGP